MATTAPVAVVAATSRLLYALFVVATWLALVPEVSADEASGRISGNVELRTNYFWENSTRIVAPVVSTQLDTARGVKIDGYYLVDAITSASVGAGAQTDVRFTEVRNEFGLGGSYEFHLRNGMHLRTGAFFRYSHEPDYVSYGVIPTIQLAMNDRSTVLRLRGVFMHDDVGQVFRIGAQEAPMGGGGMTANTFAQSFNTILLSPMLEQTLSRVALLLVGYDFGYLDGYLSSPYRQATVNGRLEPENHPDTRIRNNLWARIQYAFPESGTALHFTLRGYIDSWDVAAVTPEVRVYQDLGSNLMFRLRYRYYKQSTADFYGGAPLGMYSGNPLYYTADPKMTRFHVNEPGFSLVWFFPNLDARGLTWLSGAQLELTFDWRFNTNRFGDAVISTCAFRLPIR